MAVIDLLKAERCPSCGYLLTGLPEPVRCPECGLEVGDDVLLKVWDYDWGTEKTKKMSYVLAGVMVVFLIFMAIANWPLALVLGASMLVGKLAAYWRRPTHQLWLSSRGHALHYGRFKAGAMTLMPWPGDAQAEVQMAAEKKIVLRVWVGGDQRLGILSVTMPGAVEEFGLLRERMGRWLAAGRKEALGIQAEANET